VGNGNITLLDFCASWCAPCAAATQDVQPFVQEMVQNGIGVNFIRVLVDGPPPGVDATLSDSQNWSTTYGNPYPVLTGLAD